MEYFRLLLMGLLVLFTGAVSSSCVTRGKVFSSDTKWLDETKPTQEQVTNLMGRPYKVGNSSGTATWTYGFYKHQLFGESLIKELKLYWDTDHRLKGYSFSSSFPEDTQISLKSGGASDPLEH